MRLHKWHGLGNDYLVLDTGDKVDAKVARWLCARHTGVGGDGVLEPRPSRRADYGLRIWNPDGSQAEKSGNGLRIFAGWLVRHRGAPARFTVEVAAGVVACVVEGERITVDMGRASFRPEDVPVTRALDGTQVEVLGAPLRLTAVGVGNPHCVVLRAPTEDLDSLPWRGWGAALEVHPMFPNRTNVQFARVLSPDTVELRIWERGAGETLASGSSACAVAAAVVKHGLAERALTLVMPGGRLDVRVAEDWTLVQSGPAVEVCEVALRLPRSRG